VALPLAGGRALIAGLHFFFGKAHPDLRKTPNQNFALRPVICVAIIGSDPN
jgi:hypothetical protein